MTQRVVLNPDLISSLIVNLYGNDGGGDQLVYSTSASGFGYTANLSYLTRLYTVRSGILGTDLVLECDYE